MTAFTTRTTLGRSGLRVSKLGLGSSFKAPTASYLEAFEHGWPTRSARLPTRNATRSA